MNRDTLQGSFSERRLERAVQHVSDYWIPINPKLLKKIQSGLGEGRYDSNLDLLLSDVRTDLGLFSHCLRHLLSMMKEQEPDLNTPFDPMHMFEQAGLENLKQILAIDEGDVSQHSLAQGSNLQLKRFEQVLISSSTAEVLSEKYEVDSHTASTAALLRQLGYTLIAWNYPGVYQESMTRLKEGKNLDFILTEELGFSPTLLALRVLHQWGMTATSCAYLGLAEDEELQELEEFEAELIDGIGSTLTQLCKVGEALARANDPEHYPSARDDWEGAKLEIEGQLGPRGMDMIREKFEESCETYTTYAPEMFQAGLVLDPEALFEELDGAAQLDVDTLSRKADRYNPFLSCCETTVQEELKRLYSLLDDNEYSRENVRRLVRETIPVTDFSGGCIFTLDPGLMMLVPQVKFGTVKARELEPVDYSVVISNSDLVALAYQTMEPTIEYQKSSEKEVLTAIRECSAARNGSGYSI